MPSGPAARIARGRVVFGLRKALTVAWHDDERAPDLEASAT
jgi:hypothetical protein